MAVIPGPIYQLINPLLEFDVATNTPLVPDYLLYCDGSKIIINGTENLYALNFYNNLVANPNLGSTFAINIAEMSFIVPDLRNRVLRSSGSLLEPYKTQEDAMQPITGSIGNTAAAFFINTTYQDATFVGTGSFKANYLGIAKVDTGGDGATHGFGSIDIDSSLVARAASETRVKSYGVFTCIDIRG